MWRVSICFLFLFWPLLVSATTEPRKSDKGLSLEVTKDIRDLRSAIKKIRGLEAKKEKAQENLETKILGVDGRKSAYNEISMEARILRNYRADALDDIGYLKEHWKLLSGEERGVVDEAAIDLDFTE